MVPDFLVDTKLAGSEPGTFEASFEAFLLTEALLWCGILANLNQVRWNFCAQCQNHDCRRV
jgi:hypothetical protein